MPNTPEPRARGRHSRVTRRRVLQATAGALAAGAVSGRGAAQASGPTVYVGSTTHADETGTLYAVDAATGEQAWAFETGTASSSPTVVDGTVYTGARALYALDGVTGEQEWTFEVNSDLQWSSPTVVDGTVYVGIGTTNLSDGALYAVDAATGEREWAFETGVPVLSPPTVVDDIVYAGTADATLYAVDAATGEQARAFGTGTNQSSTGIAASSPAVVDGTVYVGSRHLHIDSESTLHAVDAETGEQEWAFATSSSVSPPAVRGGTVYIGSDNTLYAVDTTTGEQAWTFEVDSETQSSPPTVVDGTVYVGSESPSSDNNTLYAVDAATGEQEWAFDTSGSVSLPTAKDGAVYVGSGGNLYAVDVRTGQQEWKFNTGSSATSSPTVVDDPDAGGSIGSRVMLGTLGHHGNWRYAEQRIDIVKNKNSVGTPAMLAVGGGGGLTLIAAYYGLTHLSGDADETRSDGG